LLLVSYHLMVLLVLQELLGLQVPKVLRVQLGLQVPKVLRVQQVQLVLKE
jgi:hypothetical protein